VKRPVRRSGLSRVRRPARKYNNRTTVIDGLSFDSSLEALHYQGLKLLERRGEVSDIQCQVPFRLSVNGAHVCAWIADFTWVDPRSGEFHAVDVKSPFTRTLPVYRLKAKLFEAVMGFAIEEA
jgi:hypothetical protein